MRGSFKGIKIVCVCLARSPRIGDVFVRDAFDDDAGGDYEDVGDNLVSDNDGCNGTYEALSEECKPFEFVEGSDDGGGDDASGAWTKNSNSSHSEWPSQGPTTGGTWVIPARVPSWTSSLSTSTPPGGMGYFNYDPSDED